MDITIARAILGRNNSPSTCLKKLGAYSYLNEPSGLIEQNLSRQSIGSPQIANISLMESTLASDCVPSDNLWPGCL